MASRPLRRTFVSGMKPSPVTRSSCSCCPVAALRDKDRTRSGGNLSQTRTIDNDRAAPLTAVSRDKGITAKRAADHASQLLDQPWLAVVVVEHEHAIGSERGPSGVQRLLREEKTLEAEIGDAGSERERIRAARR